MLYLKRKISDNRKENILQEETNQKDIATNEEIENKKNRI